MSQVGLRDLQAPGNLQKLLDMFSVAASSGDASKEHAHIILRYLDTRQASILKPPTIPSFQCWYSVFNVAVSRFVVVLAVIVSVVCSGMTALC